MTRIARFGVLVAVLAYAQSTLAQEAYPARPIRMILPFGAGGTVDIMARPIAAKLYDALGKPVIIDNRPSAGGILSAELTAQAAPDGHTLFFASSSALFIAPAYFKQVRYNTVRDFAPITLVAQQPLLIVGGLALPVKSVKELVAYAAAHPGKISYGTVGQGSSNHLTGELLSRAAGIKMEPITYKSGAQGIAATIAGEIQIMITQPNTGLPHVKAGRVNAIATTGATRSPTYPDVGTLVEAGYTDLEIIGYYAVVAPAKVPPPILQRLNSEIRRVVESPDMRALMARQGTEPVTSTPEELAALIKKESAHWHRAVQVTGLKQN
jgi:tripartite-type tricarboxylate transporter receptor subunit TctC